MPARWTCIRIPLLACQRLVRLKPALRRKPFAVIEQIGAKVAIVAPSPAALRFGIKSGMTLAAARALIPDLPICEREASKDALALEMIAEWAQCLGPWVGIYADDAVVVETSGSARLFGGEERMLRESQRRTSKLGYLAKIAIADTPRAAHALCLAGQSLVAEANSPQLAELPLAALSLDSGSVESFAALGIHQIGALLALPRASLAARFDSDFLRRLDEFTGAVKELPLRFEASPELAERVEFDTPLEDGNGLLFILKRLADRLSERLGAMGLGARILRLSFGFEKERRVEEIGLAEPSASAKAWLMLLSARLEKLADFPPIYHLTLEASQRGAIKGSQRQIFDAKPTRDAEAFVSLLDRISARIGVSNICRPELSEEFLPEREWRPADVFGAAKPTPSERLPRRPALLFRDPRALRVESELGVPRRVGRNRVVAATGPERIMAGWLDGGEMRDYWQVTLDDGECLWLFLDHADGLFYQHGVFA